MLWSELLDTAEFRHSETQGWARRVKWRRRSSASGLEEVRDDMKGITAILIGAFAIAVNAEWRYHESTDLMDDSKFSLALSPRVESSTPADHNPQATLRIGCDPERDEGYRGRVVRPSLWATYLNLDGYQGRVRFGDEPPVTMGAWADGGDDIASLGLLVDLPDAWGFVSRLLDVDRVLVELPQYGANPVFMFSVGDAAKKAIRQVFNACNVSEATGRTHWWREGTLALVSERRTRRPRWSGNKPHTLDGDAPILNERTGYVVIPYVQGDSVIAVEVNGEAVTFTSTGPWNFTVPWSSALAGDTEITYLSRTIDQNTIALRGQYERRYKLTFEALTP